MENQLEGYSQTTDLCVIMFILLITQKSMIINILIQKTEKRP
jgi:hypothetical protein